MPERQSTMPKSLMTKIKTYKVEIPESFLWVISQWNIWYKEHKTGEFRLIFKDGGISGIEKKEYQKPPKK